MSHCVAGYQPYCEEGYYAVFPLQLADKRAARGMILQPEGWISEQIRGPGNEPVSPAMGSPTERVACVVSAIFENVKNAQSLPL